MQKFVYTLLILLSIQLYSFSQIEATTSDNKKVLLFDDKTWEYLSDYEAKQKPGPITNLELPKANSSDDIIKHLGYTLLYSEEHEQAIWVAYELTKEETNKVVARKDKFIPDPMIKTGSAVDDDYLPRVYDRGHLAPAADMLWSMQAMQESFYFSNMSPQLPSFNRGIWKNLEALVRSWAIECDGIYIVTGPILKKGLPTIGSNQVTVPKYYYKVVLDYTQPELKAIGFILPNQASKSPLQTFAVTIDSVEKVTGLDFFYQLPDVTEKQLESQVCMDCWSWKKPKSDEGGDTGDIQKTGEATQCMGQTKAGSRCKNKTTNENSYCYLHQSQDTNSSGVKVTASDKESKPKEVNSGETTASGKTIYIGSRGGRYHYSKNGKKVYEKK